MSNDVESLDTEDLGCEIWRFDNELENRMRTWLFCDLRKAYPELTFWRQTKRPKKGEADYKVESKGWVCARWKTAEEARKSL